jgi:hypothetical protein
MSALMRSVIVMTRAIASVGFGGVILWYVAVHSGERKAAACVHVGESDVDVVIDDASYHVETRWDSPLVCDLWPGDHKLRLIRGGQVVSEQCFTLGEGEETVLAIGDPSADVKPIGDRPTVLVNNPHDAIGRRRTSP